MAQDLSLLDHDHRAHRTHRIEKIHLSHPLAHSNCPEQDFAIPIASHRMQHTADHKEQPAVRFSLRYQNVSLIRQMKIAVRTQRPAILLRERRHRSNRRKVRPTQVLEHLCKLSLKFPGDNIHCRRLPEKLHLLPSCRPEDTLPNQLLSRQFVSRINPSSPNSSCDSWQKMQF